jgi:protein-disulfide isomerase
VRRAATNVWRRRLIGAVLAIGLGAGMAQAAAPAVAPPSPSDMSLGDPHARVTVIEYGSASCPHCAHFNNEVFPAFKAKFIDTGRVRYIFREFLTSPEEVAAASFLLARCAGKDKYFSVLDAIFHAQEQMYQTGDVSGTLLRIAKDAGLDEAKANACLSDQAAIKALDDRINGYIKNDKINSTPTFIINGERFRGDNTLEDLSEAVHHAEDETHRGRDHHMWSH